MNHCSPLRPAGLILPPLALTTKYSSPLARYLQVDGWPVGQVVQVRRLARFGHSHLDLSALVPLVERCYGDEVGLSLQRRAQGVLVVLPVDAVARVREVPGPHAGVHVAGPHAGHKQQVVVLAEGPDGLPVAVGGAVGEAVGGEVGVEAVEAGREDVPLVLLVHHQGEEDGIVGCVAHAAALRVLQQLGPLLRVQQVRVVHVEQRQHFAAGRPVSEEGRVASVSKGGTQSIASATLLQSYERV